MKSLNWLARIPVFVIISMGLLNFSGKSAAGVESKEKRARVGSPQRPNTSELKLMDAYGKLPLRFEANKGQTDSQVKFFSRGGGYALYLTPTEAVLSLQESEPANVSDTEKPRGMRKALSSKRITDGGPPRPHGKSSVLRIQLVGANPAPKVSGLEELPGKSNYLIGNDRKKWRTNVANYAKVEYKEIYPGVDLVYYGNQRLVEHDFILAPGANPSTITMELKGGDDLSIDSHGDLVWAVGGSEVRLQKPVVYQEVDGARQEIAAAYVRNDKHRVGFELGTYDVTRRLVIDPVLSYSTYLGGSGVDEGFGIAVDSSGNAYVTGFTSSTNFPTTTGAFQTVLSTVNDGVQNAFVTKLNSAGSLVYSTYLGGSYGAEGYGIAVDSYGNAYVTGQTFSADFPTTTGAFQTTVASDCCTAAFVTKLNPAGSALVYSTYLNGSDGGTVEGAGIAVDSSGDAYVTGSVDSTNFPTTTGAFQTTLTLGAGGNAFVTELNPAGSGLVYSTYLGGNTYDQGNGIALDSSGDAYVTGLTNSTNFPTSAGAVQTVYGGGGVNAFVTELNPAGSGLVYSTYLGGNTSDLGNGIAVDSSGDAYVTGYADSPNFPTTPGAFQTILGAGGNAFVTELNPGGSQLVYSTFLGGSNGDGAYCIAVDSAGDAYVTGGTGSTDFPTTPGAFQTTIGGKFNAFVTELNPAGSALVYSTFLGGSGNPKIKGGGGDGGYGIAVDPSGNIWVTGYTPSSNFPTTAGAFQTALGGSFNAFVTELGADLATQLQVTQQPSAGAVGSPIGNVVVQVEDGNGNLVSGSTVAVMIASAPTGVGGTLKVNAVGGVATFSNLVFSAANSYTLTASSTGLTSATSASIIQITQASQTITFGPLLGQVYGAPPFTVSAIASSGLPVSFASLTQSVCTVSGNTVTLIGVGQCTIQATQAGNATYSAAPPLNQSFQVIQGTPTVGFTGAPASAPYEATFTVTATTNASVTAVITASGACSVAGALVTITAPSGTCLLTATWVADSNYMAATATQSTIAIKATPKINWANPAAITYGTALTGTQLDATATYNGATVAGTFVYTPAKGIVLDAGSQILSVSFTPNKTADYNGATASVTLQVNQTTPKITWAKPAAITYGTALSSTQLDAKESVPGNFVYSPSAGTVLSAGAQTLSVTFTPTDTIDYSTATDTVTITVDKAASTITWPTPAPVIYGTALSSTQLDATASVPGAFVYSPAAGATPAGGSDKLSVTFTPADTTDYTTATASVMLQVNPATPVINWATPVAITYGTALSGTQLDANATYNGASVGGTFVYTPAKGTVLTAGTNTLSVTFTPNNTANYNGTSDSVTLQVNQATPKITWTKPAAITYGTALSRTQLDATASVPGSFVYSPPSGTVLSAGTQTLSVTFTPTDTTDYTTATDSVTITVKP